MMEATKWILDRLRDGNWETEQVYALYSSFPWNANLSEEGFKRQVRKIKTKFRPTGNLAEDFDTLVGAVSREQPNEKNTLDDPEATDEKQTFRVNGNEADLDVFTERIVTIEQLLAFCEVDESVWYVEKYELTKWEVGAKGPDKKIRITPLFRINAKLARIKPEEQEIPVVHPLVLPRLPYTPGTQRHPVNRYLILGDAQIGFKRNFKTGELQGFHDRSAMNVVLQILEDHQFQEIVLLGDMLDVTEASNFIQKPEFYQTLQPAIEELGNFLVSMRELAPHSKITFMAGNHEIRLQKRLMENLAYAYNLKAFGQDLSLYSLRNLLGLDNIDVDVIEEYPEGERWLTDNLVVVHGSVTKLSSQMKILNVNTIMGHVHREETLSKTLKERTQVRSVKGVVIGCLCKIDGSVPGSEAGADWQNGCVVVDELDGVLNINHITIRDGRATYAGMLYNGN